MTTSADDPHEQTNVEFVVELMEFSRSGALAQIFVIEALSKYADAVAAMDPKLFDGALLCGESWVRCAREIKAKLDTRYGSYSKPEPGIRTAYL